MSIFSKLAAFGEHLKTVLGKDAKKAEAFIESEVPALEKLLGAIAIPVAEGVAAAVTGNIGGGFHAAVSAGVAVLKAKAPEAAAEAGDGAVHLFVTALASKAQAALDTAAKAIQSTQAPNTALNQ